MPTDKAIRYDSTCVNSSGMSKAQFEKFKLEVPRQLHKFLFEHAFAT